MSPFGDHLASPFSGKPTSTTLPNGGSFVAQSPTSTRSKVNAPIRSPGIINRVRADSTESGISNAEEPFLSRSPNGTSGDSVGSDEHEPPLTPNGSIIKKLNLYKTELCRSWEETGTCRYGNKCQFAHSGEEVRGIDRHPKYKTEMCKTFWERRTCPYGKTCCFIHTRSDKLNDKNGPMSAGPLTNGSASPNQMAPQRLRSNSNSMRNNDDIGINVRRSKPMGIYTERNGLSSAPPADIKSLFDPVQDGFSLWSPSLGSPDRNTAFSFDQRTINESRMRQQQHQSWDNKMVPNNTPYVGNPPSGTNINHVEQALQSFHLNSPLDGVASQPKSANPLALLKPITTNRSHDFNNAQGVGYSRSALSQSASAGGPIGFFGDGFENSSRIAKATPLENVPILATPPRGTYVKTRGEGFGPAFSPIGTKEAGLRSAPIKVTPPAVPSAPLSPTFAQIACSQAAKKSAEPVNTKFAALKKGDSGVNIYDEK